MRELRDAGRLLAVGLGWVLIVGGLALAATVQDPPPDAAPATGLIGHKTTRLYHRPTCASVQKLAAKARVDLADPAAAVAGGFAPCRVCRPDAAAPATPAAGADAPDGAPAPKATGPQAKARRKSASPKAGRSTAKAATPPPAPATPPAGTPAAAEADGTLKFSRDIAPILAGNCLGCHNAQRKQGELDLSTFEALLAGDDAGPVVVPGNPEQSRLVEQVVTRKMPRGGGNRRLSDAAIAKLQTWVKQGAILDAGPGISPTATLDKIAPTPEQRRAAELAKLSPEQRDAKLAELAKERFGQAGVSEPPTITPGRGVQLFSRLPEDRATALVKVLDEQRQKVVTLLGPEASGPLGGPEKLSLYVFPDAASYAEFVRGVERRELEAGLQAHGRLGVEGPYLAAIDPLGGAPEPAATPAATGTAGRKASGKSRKAAAEEAPSGPERSLAGLLTEQLGQAAVAAGGKGPRWLAEGLGASLAAAVEPRSAYYVRLRQAAAEQYQLGWGPRATEALGDQGSPETLRAIGLSLFDWLSSDPAARTRLPLLVRGLCTQGGAQIDELIREAYNGVGRDEFLALWGQSVAGRPGGGRRR